MPSISTPKTTNESGGIRYHLSIILLVSFTVIIVFAVFAICQYYSFKMELEAKLYLKAKKWKGSIAMVSLASVIAGDTANEVPAIGIATLIKGRAYDPVTEVSIGRTSTKLAVTRNDWDMLMRFKKLQSLKIANCVIEVDQLDFSAQKDLTRIVIHDLTFSSMKLIIVSLPANLQECDLANLVHMDQWVKQLSQCNNIRVLRITGMLNENAVKDILSLKKTEFVNYRFPCNKCICDSSTVTK